MGFAQSVKRMMEVEYRDLGRMGYSECWALQRSLFERILAAKRSDVADELALDENMAGWMLFVEHNPVYTLGKSGTQTADKAFAAVSASSQRT